LLRSPRAWILLAAVGTAGALLPGRAVAVVGIVGSALLADQVRRIRKSLPTIKLDQAAIASAHEVSFEGFYRDPTLGRSWHQAILHIRRDELVVTRYWSTRRSSQIFPIPAVCISELTDSSDYRGLKPGLSGIRLAQGSMTIDLAIPDSTLSAVSTLLRTPAPLG
jgi:hypothetical protein